MTWALDTFTTQAEEVLRFCNFLLLNREKLRQVDFKAYMTYLHVFRTYHSLEEPKYLWIWLPYEQEDAKQIQEVLLLIRNDPVFFLLRAIYFNEGLAPESKL